MPTKSQLVASLAELGIEASEEMKKAELEEMLSEAEAMEMPEDEPEAGEDEKPAESASEELPEPMRTAEYQFLSNVKHNGKRFSPGDMARLNPEDAIPLLESGAIQAAE